MEDGLAEWFPVESGVRQGCLLSPILFSILINFVCRSCHFRQGIQLSPERQIHDCNFADDIVLVAHCQEDIQHHLNELVAKAALMGLKINVDKRKSMSNSVLMTILAGIRYEGTDIEEVREFKYLGRRITQDGNCDGEVLLRIAYTCGTFSQLKNIWRCRCYSQNLKLRLFRGNVLSVL